MQKHWYGPLRMLRQNNVNAENENSCACFSVLINKCSYIPQKWPDRWCTKMTTRRLTVTTRSVIWKMKATVLLLHSKLRSDFSLLTVSERKQLQ